MLSAFLWASGWTLHLHGERRSCIAHEPPRLGTLGSGQKLLETVCVGTLVMFLVTRSHTFRSQRLFVRQYSNSSLVAAVMEAFTFDGSTSSGET